jgi:hypothetical protein
MKTGQRIVVFTAALFAWHCTSPVNPCACSPPMPPEAVITGQVILPSGIPSSAGLVTAEVIGSAPCSTTAPSQSLLFAPVGTGARFRLTLGVFGGQRCYRFYADPPSGSTLTRSDTQIVSVNFDNYPAVPDSVELAFVLRAP